MLFTPRVFSHAYMLWELHLIVLMSKGIISSLSETRTTSFFSLATLRVVVGFLILASQLHYISEQLDLSLIMLPLKSIDSASSLKSAFNVCVTISRWKHINTFLQTVLDLLTVPWLIHLHQLRTFLIFWKSIQVPLSSFLKNSLFLSLSLYECSNGFIFCFCR